MIKVKISVDIWLKFCKVEDNGLVIFTLSEI